MDHRHRKLYCLLGAPGSGKGTQGALLATHIGGIHVSVGELVRAAVAVGGRVPRDRKTRLVDTQYTVDLIVRAVGEDEGGDIVLDGFPRDAGQVDALTALPWRCTSAIWLSVDFDTAIKRMVGRGRTGEDIARIGLRHLNHDRATDALRERLTEAGVRIHDVDASADVEAVQEECREVTHSSCG